MNNQNILICFTSSFPYGLKETYFENELPYLSRVFKEVHIFPLYNPSKLRTKRTVPSNCIVHEIIARQGLSRVFFGIFNFSPLNLYLKELFKYKLFKNRVLFLRWFNSMLVFRASHYKFKKYIKKQQINKKITLYSYWAEIPLFVTDLVKCYFKVVRMHGGDFYLERSHNYLPLRENIYNSASLLIPISEDISNRLKDHYNIDKTKIIISRVGVNNNIESCKVFENDFIRIVSCSNVIPLKRVDLIIDFIVSLVGKEGLKVHWDHFGDGPDFENIKNKIQSVTAPNLSYKLHGRVSQKQLFDFYKDTFVHWFINLSLYEGVPVSIMEANSFGIPAIATDVGGTSEIVNSENGILIPKDFESNDLIIMLKDICLKDYFLKRKNAYNMWVSKFNADSNYKTLASILMNGEKNE